MRFDRYQFVLMPNTHDHVQSIHVDLATNRLTDHEAMTIINRFLSIMTWCDDQFAVAQDGWSGNPVPVPVPRRNLASTTTHHWIFDRQIPASKKARRALALYREARNAQQNFLVSYAVLNFYKIVELKSDVSGEVKNWFRDNFERLAQDQSNRDIFAHFVKISEARNRPNISGRPAGCCCARQQAFTIRSRRRKRSDPSTHGCRCPAHFR